MTRWFLTTQRVILNLMQKLVMRLFMGLNTFIIRISRGKLGSNLGGNQILLLHTVGRKSGKAYTIPLNHYRDGRHYVVVASNWARTTNPGWYYNVLAQPETTIEFKGETVAVSAHEAVGEERERLWQAITAVYEQYPKYQAKTSRLIPLIVLVPKDN